MKANYVPALILRALHAPSHLILRKPYEGCIIIILFSQMGKSRHKDIKDHYPCVYLFLMHRGEEAAGHPVVI